MSLTDSTPLAVAQSASRSSRALAVLPVEARNDALTIIHQALSGAKDRILAANARDVKLATNAAANGELSQSILKRLDLSRKGKWEDMLQGILDVRNLEDSVSLAGVLHHSRDLVRNFLVRWLSPGSAFDDKNLPAVVHSSPMALVQFSGCPIGVLLVIFEARPEVIANIASLAIKSGNAVILKGGKESTDSFIAISRVIADALDSTAVPNAAIQLLTTRDVVASLLELDRYIDLVIPRGSNELVRYVKDHTRIPVLGHADGLCHIYIHEDADAEMAVKVIVDAKVSYPAACNAVETLLVHENALSTILPPVAQALLQHGVSLRCDPPSKAVLTTSLQPHQSTILQDATEKDFTTEFLDLILAIKTIPAAHPPSSCDFAIAHINAHSSSHTDAILTASRPTAQRFQAGVDSACVFWNTSTRMSDGMRFGFGTEVGISTNKIHARGPVGLEGLMIYKYVLNGEGQVAGSYFEGPGGKKWKHERLEV